MRQRVVAVVAQLSAEGEGSDGDDVVIDGRSDRSSPVLCCSFSLLETAKLLEDFR